MQQPARPDTYYSFHFQLACRSGNEVESDVIRPGFRRNANLCSPTTMTWTIMSTPTQLLTPPPIRLFHALSLSLTLSPPPAEIQRVCGNDDDNDDESPPDAEARGVVQKPAQRMVCAPLPEKEGEASAAIPAVFDNLLGRARWSGGACVGGA